jgi:hypothetical protein
LPLCNQKLALRQVLIARSIMKKAIVAAEKTFGTAMMLSVSYAPFRFVSADSNPHETGQSKQNEEEPF